MRGSQTSTSQGMSRHVEVADLKGEVAGLKSEISRLKAGEDPGNKTAAIEKLRRESEVKKLQLKESEDNLLRTAGSLRGVEGRDRSLEAAMKAAEAETEDKSAEIESLKD